MSRTKFFLSAGEASGEQYGALLIAALRQRAPDAEFFGLGGERMQTAGLRRIVRAEDVAVMGVTEVIAHMPRIYSEYRRLKASIEKEKPDVGILIDFPDVNLRLAEHFHRLKIPVVYFVSPQLWAWKKGRIRRVQKYVTKMLVIFPFEETFYRRHGVEAEFVGHPLSDLALPRETATEFARENHLDTSKPWIGMLPGSRKNELRANLPAMLETVKVLGPRYEFLWPVAPTLQMEDARKALGSVRESVRNVHLVRDARSVLFHSRASVVASGTATVEAALIGNPFIIVYRVSPITYAVARRVVKLPFAGMPNLIAGREVVPELLQENCTVQNIVRKLSPLLDEGSARETIVSDLQEVQAALQSKNTGHSAGAIERAASVAYELAVPASGLPSRELEPPNPESVRSHDAHCS